MNKTIICRFGTKEALDAFNARTGFNVSNLTKTFNVHTQKKVDRKKPLVQRGLTAKGRDWWKPYWWGMPEYESHDAPPPYACMDFVFDHDDLEYANKIFDQNISDKTKSIWFPRLVPAWYRSLRVIGGTSEHRYPIYVISKGRAEKCYTSRFLSQMEMTHFVVCEPQEYEEYKKNLNLKYATIIQLDMSYKDRYDTCDEMDESFPKGSGPARNFCWDDSIKRGYKWHWLMDDNAAEGFFWFWHNIKIKSRTGALLAASEDFVDRYENIAIYGPAYSKFAVMDNWYPPFIVNTRIYSCLLIRNDIKDKNGVPFRWRGRFNEDTDLSLRVLKDGWCTVQSNWMLFGKATTMKIKGGNTDSIYVDGTKLKSEMIARLHPDVAKVKWKFNRWHHEVNYDGFKQELKLKPGVQPVPGIDNYGMRVIMTEETECYDTRSYLEEKYKDTPDYVYDPKSAIPTTKPVNPQSAPITPPTKPTQKTLIVDGLNEIDPRTFGQLMMKLHKMIPELVVVHGDETTGDVIVKLCQGLGVEWRPLRDLSGAVIGEYSGKTKLVHCQPGDKPRFELVS